MFRQLFRNLLSCKLVLDLGSLHQKPLILYIVTRLCWFLVPNIVVTSCQFRASCCLKIHC